MSDTSKKKVLIGVPSWGWAPPECCDYRNELWYELGRWAGEPDCNYTFQMGTVADIMVQMARDKFAEATIEGGFDYLGMIDDDMMGGPPDMWRRLLARNVPIVAPLAFMRNKPHDPVLFTVRGGWIPGSPNATFTTQTVKNYPKNSLVEADAVGFGAVLIKAEVFKAMPVPRFKHNCDTGEDILFCVRAGQLGYKCYMDTAICLKHLGPRQYIDETWYESHRPDVVEMRRQLGDWTKEKAKDNIPA